MGVFCSLIKPKIISWNVRGLYEVNKCMLMRNLLRTWKAGIVTLQETKLEQISMSIVQSLWGGQHLDWCQLDSRGAPSGWFDELEEFEEVSDANVVFVDREIIVYV
jgi:hypothetical protein